MVRARPLAFGPSCTELAAADPLPATKSPSARAGTGAAETTVTRTPATTAATRLPRGVTVVTPSLFDAAASWASSAFG